MGLTLTSTVHYSFNYIKMQWSIWRIVQYEAEVSAICIDLSNPSSSCFVAPNCYSFQSSHPFCFCSFPSFVEVRTI